MNIAPASSKQALDAAFLGLKDMEEKKSSGFHLCLSVACNLSLSLYYLAVGRDS